MANEEQLAILRQGVEVWNKWREENPSERIDLRSVDCSYLDLSEVNLHKADLARSRFKKSILRGANLDSANIMAANLNAADLVDATLTSANMRLAKFWGANLTNTNLANADLSSTKLLGANLNNAMLVGANLNDANLTGASLNGAILVDANLKGAELLGAMLISADLTRANLQNADLTDANVTGANLTDSCLFHVTLVQTRVKNAVISRSKIYGVNVWNLKGEFKEQKDLIITLDNEFEITVDNIEVAQFIYLILNNKKIRSVLNTLASKTVLILGRFAIPERKAILDALRNKLREYDLLPIVFDFDRPTDKDFTETIKTLAGISYFVIADVTNPKSSPLELQATVPDYQIPFVPIIQEGESPFAMMVDLQKKYNWVLPTRSYDSIETLISALKPGIIDPAVAMRNKLRQIKAQEHPTESLKDYLDKTL